MKLLLFSLISLYFLIGFIPNKADANDFDLTIITSDGGDLDILQDGEDNNIDLDVQSMDNFELDFSQVGNDNNINIDVDGRTSNGSSIFITQTGNNKNYNANLFCGHSFCTMTLNQ
tara:strand:+ start:656 stop:1003 length:348 start_codon:yes stop_codon:yes gene_type:complete